MILSMIFFYIYFIILFYFILFILLYNYFKYFDIYKRKYILLIVVEFLNNLS